MQKYQNLKILFEIQAISINFQEGLTIKATYPPEFRLEINKFQILRYLQVPKP